MVCSTSHAFPHTLIYCPPPPSNLLPARRTSKSLSWVDECRRAISPPGAPPGAPPPPSTSPPTPNPVPGDLTTVEQMQEGSLSMWKRQPGQLNYTIISIHKLVPPPSRISNNATVNVLCLAASLWLRCNTDPSHETLVSPLHHTTTSFGPLPTTKSGKQPGARTRAASSSPVQDPKDSGPSNAEAHKLSMGSSLNAETPPTNSDSSAADAAARLTVQTAVANTGADSHQAASNLQPTSSQQHQKDDQESLLVMSVSDDGHVWQWDVPLYGFLPPPKPPTPTSGLPKTAPTTAAGPLTTAPAKPALLGLLHTLPHSVTTFSVCPVPVGAGWAGDLNQPSGQSGEGGDAVAVLAAVTSAGNVELITLQRGALTPLSSTISVSLGMLPNQY